MVREHCQRTGAEKEGVLGRGRGLHRMEQGWVRTTLNSKPEVLRLWVGA